MLPFHQAKALRAAGPLVVGGLLLALVALLAACGGGSSATSGPAGQRSSAPAGSGGGASAATTAIPTVTATAGGSSTVTLSPTPTTHLPMSVASSAFASGAVIPTPFTCSGADESPPLAWSHVPAGTTAFALIVIDTDAAGFVHWVAVDIPGDRTAMAAGSPAGMQGRNSFGRVGYGGPCPPVGSGTHHYVFTLYALSRPLGLAGAPTAAAVRTAAATVTLATAHTTGTFRR